MIYEFAIEPALAVAWAKHRNEFEYYYEKFGLGQPKIMSEFPKFKNWRRQFKRAAAGAQDFELQRITALFNLLIEDVYTAMVFSMTAQFPGLKMPKQKMSVINFKQF